MGLMVRIIRINVLPLPPLTSNYLHLQHVAFPSPQFSYISSTASAYLKQLVLQCGQLQVVGLLSGDSVQPVSDLLQPDLQGLQADVSLAHHPSGHHERRLSLRHTHKIRHLSQDASLVLQVV